jgi:hypothetical protein
MAESLPYSGLDDEGNWIGLSVDRVKFLSSYLGFTIKYGKFSRPTENQTFSDVLRLQTQQNYSTEGDFFVGTNFAITPERLTYASFVDAYIPNSAYLIMETSKENHDLFHVYNLFRFLAPFRLAVWLMLLGGILLCAIALWTIDVTKSVRRMKSEFNAAPTSAVGDPSTSNDVEMSSVPKLSIQVTEKQAAQTPTENIADPNIDQSISNFDAEKLTFMNSLYYSTASLTGVGQLEPNNWLSKVFVLAWSTFVLLMVSSYTANLAAYLSSSDSGDSVSLSQAIDSGAMKCFYRSSPYAELDPTMDALGYPRKACSPLCTATSYSLC